MDGRGVVVGRPIQGDQQRARTVCGGIERNPEGIDVAASAQGLKYLRKEREQVSSRHGIEHRADTIVRWDLAHAQERLGIALATGLLHRPLIGQKRWALRSENRKGRQRRIFHGIDAVLPGPFVRSRPHHFFERFH